MTGRRGEELGAQIRRRYGRKLCGAGGSGNGFWDSDGGHVHLLSRAQAAERGAVGGDCPWRGSTDATGTLRGGAIAAVWNFAGSRRAGLYRDVHADWTNGAG